MRVPWISDNAIEEECGIEEPRLRTWAEHEPLAKRCTVELEPLPPREIGAAVLPRCRMRISGAREDCLALYERFFLTFMSAGG